MTSVDFFTYSVLDGVGYTEPNPSTSASGFQNGDAEPADQAGNKDGKITLKELFNYAKQKTMELVQRYSGQAPFRGTSAQTPQSFLGKLASLVLFGRS